MKLSLDVEREKRFLLCAADVAGLASLTRLQSLTLSGCNWGQQKATLTKLSSLVALTHLDLSSPRARSASPFS